MRACIIITVALIAAAITAQPLIFFVVEVRFQFSNGIIKTEYFVLKWKEECELKINVPSNITWIIVRVDSTSPFKPYAVSIDGVRTIPSLDEGIILIEDFVLINITKLKVRPSIITISFRKYEAKPPIYAVVDLPDEGNTWGYIVGALLKGGIPGEIPVKVTVLVNRTVSIPSLVVNSTFREVVFLITGDDPAYLINVLRNHSIELKVKPLYYIAMNKYTKITRRRALFIYINLPSACKIIKKEIYKTNNIFNTIAVDNPYFANQSSFVELPKACDIKFEGSAPFEYTIGGRAVASEMPLGIVVPLDSGKFKVQVYRRGVLAFEAEIYGIAPYIKLPSLGYGVEVTVVDQSENPVNNILVRLHGKTTAILDSCLTVKGRCLFEAVPPGTYVVRAFAQGVEVGHSEVIVEDRDVTIKLVTSLVNVRISVVYPSGKKLHGYTLMLSNGLLEYRAEEKDGYVKFEKVPIGLYNYTVLRDGVVVAVGSLNLVKGRETYVVIANVSRAIIKVVDFFGKPLSGIKVVVRGPVTMSSLTDQNGVVELVLPLGIYTIEVPSLKLSSKLRVEEGGGYIVVSQSAPVGLLVVIALMVIAALIAVKRWLRNRSGIEVLELDETTLP